MLRIITVPAFCAVVAGGGMAALWLGFDDPQQLLLHNWPITPMATLAAALANATAVGGGFLFIPLFVFGYGLTATAALKLSLATQAFGMTSGAIGWSRQYIVWKAFLLACVGSSVGMYVGTYWWIMPNLLIKSIFGWVSLLICAAIVLEHRWSGGSTATSIEKDSSIKSAGLIAVCTLGGVVTAWVSIGIGEFLALYLLFVYRIRIESAIGTGVAVLAAASILGFAFHAHLGGIHWQYLAFTVPGVIIGGRFGAQLGRWVESRWRQTPHREGTRLSELSPLRWIFAVVAFLDGIFMLWQTHLATVAN